MRRSNFALSLLVVLAPGLSQAQSNVYPLPAPAPTKMQNLVGATVLQFAKNKGFSASDPRVYQTLVGASKALARDAGLVAAGTAAGAAVVGTSPGWLSLLAVSAVSVGVSYAVPIVLDKSLQWLFNANGNPVSAVTYPAANDYGAFISHGTEGCGYTALADYCKDSSTYEGYHTKTPFELQTHYLCSGDRNPTAGCIDHPGMTYEQSFAITGWPVPPKTPTVAPGVTMSDAVTGLTPAQKAMPVSPDAIAGLVNNVIQQASADPGYMGIPYSPAAAVTGDQVKATPEYASDPPTLGDATTPHPNFATDFSPAASVGAGAVGGTSSSSTSPGSSSSTTTTPTTTVTPDSTTAPDTVKSAPDSATKVDLGPDPGIGVPSLETTPTPSMILDPILNLMPSLKNYAVPSHSATCPKPTFQVFSKTITMSSHCDLLEAQRTTIYSVMLAVFALASVLIFLKA